MRCPKCNSIIENGTLFCTECGCDLQEYEKNDTENALSTTKRKRVEKRQSDRKSTIKERHEKVSLTLLGSFWGLCLLLFLGGATVWYLL